MSFSLTAPAPAVLKMCTHQNARVPISEEGGLAAPPNTLLDGKKAANLGIARWVLLSLPSGTEG